MRWTSPSTPVKLAARGVSAAQVASALQQATVVQSVGSLKQGTASIPLQVAGPLTSLDHIASIVEDPPSDPGQRLRAARTCEPELIAATR